MYTWKEKIRDKWEDWRDLLFKDNSLVKIVISVLVLWALIAAIVGVFWSSEPDAFDIQNNTAEILAHRGGKLSVGYTTTATLITVMSTLLDKKGGYISNDIMPPGVWLDNIGNWEYGVLIQVRDLTRTLRKDISRSQSQSQEDNDLVVAEPQFNFDSESWILPRSEDEYRRGIRALYSYLDRLADDKTRDGQFYARADNLRSWLMDVQTRLGSLSQRLAASEGQRRINTDLAGDTVAQQSKEGPAEVDVKTTWLELDDVFYEARGTCWALLHLLKAVEMDFAPVLQKKNALISLRQIIRELEGTQQPMWSPVVLNGTGFGMVANHSLVMASYVSRANAAIIDLQHLLEQG